MQNFLESSNGQKLAKAVLGLVGMLTIFIIFQILVSAKELRNPAPTYTTISVNGTGEATSTPNIATFSFGVMAEARDVSTAQDMVTTKMNKILADLKGLGIEDKDIRTSDYSVYPKYIYEQAACVGGICPPGRQVQDGYTASQNVTVKVRKTEDAGKALALAGKDGATNISGVTFTLDDPNAPMNDARLKAIENARANAEAIADRLGVKLGRVTSYYDNGGAQPGYPVYLKEGMGGGVDAASAPSIPTGTNTANVSVNVTFEIR